MFQTLEIRHYIKLSMIDMQSGVQTLTDQWNAPLYHINMIYIH